MAKVKVADVVYPLGDTGINKLRGKILNGPVTKVTSTDVFSLGAGLTRDAIRQILAARRNPGKAPSYKEQREKHDGLITFLSKDDERQPLGAGKDQSLKPKVISTGPKDYTHNLNIFDLVENKTVVDFYYVPRELDYSPESNFVAISSMGRNNPLYHYTGSEDTLKLELDWHAKEEDRKDVILNCRKLEALTKNDGFDKPPHHVLLTWGELFDNLDTWLVVSAPYQLSQFHYQHGMLPIQATQKLTLKRITTFNRTREEIISSLNN